MTSRLFIITVLFISNHNIFSQNNFAIGLNATPTITYSYSPSDLPSPKSNFGYSFGMNVMYYFNSNLFLETGLNYQKKRVLFIKNVPDYRYTWIDVKGNGVFDLEDRLDLSRIIYLDYYMQYSSISLPLLINYRTSQNNITSIVGSFGINLNYIFDIEGISYSDELGESSEGSKSLKDFSSSLMVGVALYQPINSGLFLIIGPKYYFDFYSNIENYNPKFHTLALEIKVLHNL